MSRSAPRPLATALEVLRRELVPQGLLARVQLVWDAAVGPAIAAQAQPTAERDGVLTVTCESSVWAQELTMGAREVLDRLNEALAGGAPSSSAPGLEARSGAVTELRCRTR